MMIKKKLLIGVMSLFTLTACGGSDDGGAATPGGATAAISLSPLALDVPANAGSYTVEVSSSETDWTATTGAQWLSVTAMGTTATKGVLTIKVEANNGTASRSATVTVKSRNARTTLIVMQAQPMEVSATSVILHSAGETATIDVTATGDWTATSADSWLTAVRSGSGLAITASPNTTGAVR
ncbi:MAG: BACON domain-containing protein, partial [Prevotella sp.]|nr:BACON domain-containing protein [Prevotella sp.]